MPRLRSCVECPQCRTRYLVGFSPYDNGAYLVSLMTETSEDYELICACGARSSSNRWNWKELKPYVVFSAAYERGYGSPEEVLPYQQREAGSRFTRI